MAGPWLYTIAANAGRNFELKDGHQPVNIANYGRLVNNGRIVEDQWWQIGQNWSKVAAGDKLFIYTGDDDRGIIGYAVIEEAVERPAGWALRLRFDLDKCKNLLRHPVPASVVRGWGLNLRKNVVDLSPVAEHLESWFSGATIGAKRYLLQRLCWNSNGWRGPTGQQYGKEHSYVGENGFGHEEWNLNTSDLIEGKVYGYTYYTPPQDAIGPPSSYDVYFFTIAEDKKRLLVGAY